MRTARSTSESCCSRAISRSRFRRAVAEASSWRVVTNLQVHRLVLSSASQVHPMQVAGDREEGAAFTVPTRMGSGDIQARTNVSSGDVLCLFGPSGEEQREPIDIGAITAIQRFEVDFRPLISRAILRAALMMREGRTEYAWPIDLLQAGPGLSGQRGRSATYNRAPTSSRPECDTAPAKTRRLLRRVSVRPRNRPPVARSDEVRLTPKAAAVLVELVTHAGEPVSKDHLFASVWKDTAVSDDALTSCIQELRRALDDDPQQPRFIETRHRRGYRFVAALRTSRAATASASLAAPAPGGISAIAVLPFADMSPGRDQDYLCEGLAEELINALTHIDGLRVARARRPFSSGAAAPTSARSAGSSAWERCSRAASARRTIGCA